MRHFILFLLAGFALGAAGVRADDLDKNFVMPPDSSRPQTWWHWMNGNITKEGITADLEAMKRVGVGGAEIFNAAEGIPHGPVQFNSPEWRDLVKFAAKEADRLGLELCIHNCGGWSSSGGPWNTPEHGMQIVVTSEKRVKGPTHFDEVVPQPSSKLGFYRDIAVLAFPTPKGEQASMMDAAPTVTSSAEQADVARVVDGKSSTWITLPLPKPNDPQFIQLEFGQPFAARELSITPGPGMQGCSGRIESSNDGKTFQTLAVIALARGNERMTVTFSPVSARFFKVLFTSANVRTKRLAIAEVEVSSRLAVSNLAGKAFYERGGDFRPEGAAPNGPEEVVQRAKTIDLSVRMAADGRLRWDVPVGDWTILRAGYAPNGMQNHPAPTEGTGLECDKLSKEAVEAHWAGLMVPLIKDLGPLAGKAFNGVLIDSYEVGTQNWTPKFREEFQRRRGYDVTPFLPVLTGRVVDSPEVTDRFLWDFRRTIADLFAENYSGTFAEMAHQYGLKFSVEPYGDCPTDDIQYGEYADIPMSEFWPSSGNGNGNPGNAKLASSIGHVFGRKYIGAESFTAAPEAGKWLKDPYSLKAQGDIVYCSGVNRLIFHRYAHQPWINRYPGMTMGQWGTHFERTTTWWEQSTAWLKYLARCQSLLQSGRFVADVCFFCGDGAPNGLRGGGLPTGYDYDGCNTDGLMSRLSVKDGRIVLPDGMSYRMLVLPSDTSMTVATLRKIKELSDAGATIVGPKPITAPGLLDYPQCDAEVKKLAAETKIISDQTPAGVLAALNIKPDFEYADKAARLVYIHRVADEADIYFVSNQHEKNEEIDCTFRVRGKAPELWHPDSGKIETAPVYTEAGDRTTVRLRFDPCGSVFVVFRKPADADHAVSVQCTYTNEVASPPADLTILKAEYGAFAAASDPESVDVTDAVKKMVKQGTLRIPASNDLAGDPAANVEKDMRIEFMDGGEHKTRTVPEGQLLELPAGAVVIKAVYGIISDEVAPVNQTMDLTEKLGGLVKDGRLSVEAGNELAGRDPANMVVKELRVEYRYAGEKKLAIVGEHQQLDLPQDDESAPAPPKHVVAVDEGGKLQIEAWEPGRFEVKTAAGKTLKVDVGEVPAPVEITGSWELDFPPNWGAPKKITLDKLISWTEHPDNGVKYFSGTATYVKDVEIPAALVGRGKALYLDLGQLKNLAEVKLNGKDLGILWKPPFRVAISGAATAGTNKLEVRVTNLWPNRLIGDEQLPDDRVWDGKHLKEWPQWLLEGKPSPTGRFTFTTWHHWTRDDAPLPSGLFGPVKLLPTVIVDVLPAP